MQVIRHFKNDDNIDVASFLVEEMMPTISDYYNDVKFDGVCAVPAHWTKKFYKGYNQSEVLARKIAREMEVPYLDNLYKKVEEFKSSEQYEQYMNNLNEFMNSEQFQSTLESIKENSKDTYNQITSNLNDFVNSDQFKTMQEDVKNFFNSKEVQDFYNKISNMFK